jgi:hypothetical protein
MIRPRLSLRFPPIPEFRGPVLFEEDAVRELCRLACRGYEAPGKRETFGFLYGTLTDEQRIIVRRACYYRGGTKTRTGIVFKNWPAILRVVQRRRELARKMRLRFLGNFHSHIEIGGEVFRGLSCEDRESFGFDRMSVLEVVVFLWPGDGRVAERSAQTIVGLEPATGYNYRIRVYAKRRHGICQATAKVIPSGVVIVF